MFRKKPSKQVAAGGANTTATKGKLPLKRADEARVTLEQAYQMSVEQIQEELERADKEGDKASQINILFLLARAVMQQEKIGKTHLQAALQVSLFHLRFEFAIIAALPLDSHSLQQTHTT